MSPYTLLGFLGFIIVLSLILGAGIMHNVLALTIIPIFLIAVIFTHIVVDTIGYEFF